MQTTTPRAIQQHGEAVPNVMGASLPGLRPEAPCQRPGLSGPPNLVWGPNLDRSTAWGPILSIPAGSHDVKMGPNPTRHRGGGAVVFQLIVFLTSPSCKP